MKQKFLYPILFGFPGLFISFLVGVFSNIVLRIIILYWELSEKRNFTPLHNIQTSDLIDNIYIILLLIIGVFIVIKMGYHLGVKRDIENKKINIFHIILSIIITIIFFIFSTKSLNYFLSKY